MYMTIMETKGLPAAVIGCLLLGLLLAFAGHVAAQAVAPTTLSEADRLRAENAVLRANLNDAQRQIVDLTSKLLAVDRATLAASIHESYHADLDWQTLALRSVSVEAPPAGSVKENKR
jgi:uncharacterized membrane protein YadS